MKRFIVTVVVILSVFFSSCNFLRNEVKPDGSRNVTLKNNKLSIEYWLGSQPEADDKDSYHLYIKSDSLSTLSPIIADMFHSTYGDAKNVQAVTIYTDTIFNASDVTLLPQHISGVQVHYLEDSYLKTNVYSYENDQVKKIDQLSSFVDYFSPKAVYETSKIFKDAKNSVFILVNAGITTKYETGKANYDKNLADYKLNIK
ncbi:MAG: hypothetical protein AAF611_16860 [Bacteroidota bacterium]